MATTGDRYLATNGYFFMATDKEAGVSSHRGCDVALTKAFNLLGKRWNGVILATLADGPAKFAELRRGVVGITDSVLSDRLAELTTADLIARSVTDARPPGVNYELTDTGRALMPVLDHLASWAADHLPDAPDVNKPRLSQSS